MYSFTTDCRFNVKFQFSHAFLDHTSTQMFHVHTHYTISNYKTLKLPITSIFKSDLGNLQSVEESVIQ